MSWNRFPTLGNVAPEVFLKARSLRLEKSIGQGDQGHVVMPACPTAAFVVIQPQFLFQLPVVLFDPPAGPGDARACAGSE